ncbi:hypothetical protein BN946_scf184785.g9 [Trametes cinnabarina]|uniref:Uncharacterized protein n=1 Tax=Pycnoporus cinnabarinus TaxID=5643 RepID=A0A060SB43_PYCCI|nr:hypothetical protein BN946_scf184785.g9 [Trametes cinnabarina]
MGGTLPHDRTHRENRRDNTMATTGTKMIRLTRSIHIQLWLLLCRVYKAIAQNADSRSLASALQNINGMSSVLSLVPVLSGKSQNVKVVGARIFPCSFVVVGLGAGRVLSKLQIGFMLMSADLYQSLIGELSSYHNEYVNKFSPSLIHAPTGTPERHSSNIIVNHNITEDYMVEAWFRTQAQAANSTNGHIYLNRQATMEYRCFQLVTSGKHVQSAILSTHLSNVREFNLFNSQYESGTLQAVGAAIAVSGVVDIFATVLVVGLSNWAYGWLALQVALIAVKVFFSSEPMRGIPIVEVAPLEDSKTSSSLPCDSRGVATAGRGSDDNTGQRLPILIASDPGYTFTDVCTAGNLVVDTTTSVLWRSHTPGIYVGQPYYMVTESNYEEKQSVHARVPANITLTQRETSTSPRCFSVASHSSHDTSLVFPQGTSTPSSRPFGTSPSPPIALLASQISQSQPHVRYLAQADGRLTLSEQQPAAEANQALQREFLACLAEVVRANKVPSVEFIGAVEAIKHGIRATMSDHWFVFGTTDLSRYLRNARRDVWWNRYL